jgi:hypothetical protein
MSLSASDLQPLIDRIAKSAASISGKAFSVPTGLSAEDQVKLLEQFTDELCGPAPKSAEVKQAEKPAEKPKTVEKPAEKPKVEEKAKIEAKPAEKPKVEAAKPAEKPKVEAAKPADKPKTEAPKQSPASPTNTANKPATTNTTPAKTTTTAPANTPAKVASSPAKTTTPATTTPAAVPAKATSPPPANKPATTATAGATFTWEELKKLNVPDGVDKANKEIHLTDAEFQKAFAMDKAAFAKLPVWKKTDMKKKAGLF